MMHVQAESQKLRSLYLATHGYLCTTLNKVLFSTGQMDTLLLAKKLFQFQLKITSFLTSLLEYIPSTQSTMC